MFWTVLLFSGFAFMFAKLGALSVTVSILSAGLQLALLVIALIAIYWLWKKVFPRSKEEHIP